jgi:hypothetical protein
MQSQPRLPPELIDRILDYLHDSPSNLRRCALVCKAWVHSSRFHLFHKISINTLQVMAARRYDKLLDAIRTCPGILSYVREVHLSVGRPQPVSSVWYEPIDILPSLLSSFTVVCKLGIYNTHWTLSSPGVRNSIRGILALPSLTHLELHNVLFSTPEHFLDLLHPNLKHLTASFPPWSLHTTPNDHAADREIQQSISLERQPCRLQLLVLDTYYNSFIDQLLDARAVDLTNLRVLDIVCPTRISFFDVSRLIKSSSSSLECLKITLHSLGMSSSCHLPHSLTSCVQTLAGSISGLSPICRCCPIQAFLSAPSQHRVP